MKENENKNLKYYDVFECVVALIILVVGCVWGSNANIDFIFKLALYIALGLNFGWSLISAFIKRNKDKNK